MKILIVAESGLLTDLCLMQSVHSTYMRAVHKSDGMRL
jgi:hypothetical protein